MVPVKYTAMTNDIKFVQVLMEKLEEKQKIYDHDEKEKEIEIQEEIDNEEN